MGNNYFTNRELSWLRFNERVLREAEDPEVPLLERLKFLAIFSSNLDEFYMIRVAGLKDLKAAGYNKRGLCGMNPEDQLNEIDTLSRELTKKREKLFENKLEELKDNKIFINDLVGGEIKERLESIFFEDILPLLSPITLSHSNPMPFIFSNRLFIYVQLEREGKSFFSVIIIPDNLQRLYQLEYGEKLYCFTVEYIIKHFLNNVYPDYLVEESIVLRVTRNADLTIEEEGAEDLLSNIKKKLNLRNKGNIVRVEVDKDVSDTLLHQLAKIMKFEISDLFVINGILDLKFLFRVASKRKSLQYSAYKPISVPYHFGNNIFEEIKKQDILQFRPYYNLSIISNLINCASEDESVFAIKMTLYRANRNSGIIRALENAARNGKHVCVVVELKARFDEESNVEWAKKLEDAGCIVTYGIFKLKIHSKCLLIVRREKGRIVRYTHISTGNYNETTAHIYNDIDYITADQIIGENASNLFNYLMGYTDHAKWSQMTIAPIELRNKLMWLIDREIANAKDGKESRIIIKINSLIDKILINKLYEASQAGVKIEGVVRGICSLQPGVAGISENIHIKSVVGRFLEHARILIFHNDGAEEVFMASADWMERNMDRRVELLLQIKDEKSKSMLKKIMELILNDNVKSWKLDIDKYIKVQNGKEKLNYQEILIDRFEELINSHS